MRATPTIRATAVSPSTARTRSLLQGVFDLPRRFWTLETLAFGAIASALVALIVLGKGLYAVVLSLLFVAMAVWGLSQVQKYLALGLLAGALVLDYGFANVGFTGGAIPIPLADLVLGFLVVGALVSARKKPPAAIALPLYLYGGWVLMRLIVDFPTYGTNAVRDATTAVEASTLLVGYYMFQLEGLTPWIRRLRPIFLVVLAYGSLFPWRETVATLGPSVGLQYSTTLLGFMGGLSVVAAGLYFNTFGRRHTAVIAAIWTVGLIGIFQLRGLYVMFPVAFLVLGWALRRSGKFLLQTVAAVTIGILALSAVSSFGVQGRLGTVSPDLLAANFATLLGASGPNAGSIQHRLLWTETILEELGESPQRAMTGMGLGPDLALGFRNPFAIDVRKPHNDYLEALARLGVIGFLFFLWLLVAPLTLILRGARRGSGSESRFCAWAAAAAVAYLGVAATQPLLAYSYATIPLFFLLGFGVAAAERVTATRSERPTVAPPALTAPTGG